MHKAERWLKFKFDSRFYQIITIASAVLLFFGCVFMKKLDIDYVGSLYAPTIFMLIGFFITVVSFLNRTVKTHFAFWYYAYGSALTFFGIYEAALNHFVFSHICYAFLGFLLFIPIFQHYRLMLLYSGLYVFQIVILIAMNHTLSEVDKLSVCCSFILVAILVNVYSAIRIILTDSYRFLAEHDTLTGAYNRDYFNRTVHELIEQQRKFSVLFMDLNNFKEINDTLGHDVGDKVLQAFTQSIETSIGHGILARWGGDEFSVVLPDVHSDDESASVANRIITELASPFAIEAIGPLSISVSIGCVIWPDDGNDMITIFKKADRAMYKAKQSGESSSLSFS
ncbi:diguanylate cyclase domain-containing protein [Alicyclobacillus fodiniaquatilis]|uniref:Diguanylate cyclase domain-containing protein n=1 Tax=Alicyclobacillus fodiniaquatilis TaxID=1661150 RepID=A0ABW4JHA3_9BACL